MLYAEFQSLADAQAHRRNHGGWIFFTDRSEALWFPMSCTPSLIFTHRATLGRSGKLI